MRSPWPTRSCWAKGFFPWLKLLPEPRVFPWLKIYQSQGFFPMAQTFTTTMKKLKKKVSCLREMVAGSPAEEMPNGAAIKPWYWLMKIGYNLSMVWPEKILFLEQLGAGGWGMVWRGSCKIVREEEEERREVGLQRLLAGSQPVREPTLRRRIASRRITCVTFLAEAFSVLCLTTQLFQDVSVLLQISVNFVLFFTRTLICFEQVQEIAHRQSDCASNASGQHLHIGSDDLTLCATYSIKSTMNFETDYSLL